MSDDAETQTTDSAPEQLPVSSPVEDFHGITKFTSKEEFNKILFDKDYFAELCKACLQGDHPTGLPCRWTAWRILLGLIPQQDEKRIREEVQKSRDYYASEYNKYFKIRPETPLEAEIDNPLSTNKQNPWNSYYADSEIKEKIILDTKRTYQEIPFFTLKDGQDMLLEVLFIWSKQNPDLCYRQGMNEIVAVIACVCYGENFKPEDANEDLHAFLNDEKYAKADIYSVFNKMMQLNHKAMFIFGQNTQNAKKSRKPQAPVNRPNLPIVKRATEIQEKLLPRLNETLFSHLSDLEVDPHIYMIKWIRCLLSREFELPQVLRIWDCIFAYYHFYTPFSKTLDMLDYFCASLILSIADELLQRDDESIILGRLVKYPHVEDATNIIRMCYYGVLSKLRAQDSRNTELDDSQNGNSAASPGFLSTAAKEESKKGMFLFNPSNPLLKQKPNKEQAVTKYHQSFSQNTNQIPAVRVVDDPLTQKSQTNTVRIENKEAPIPILHASKSEPKQESKSDSNPFSHYIFNKINFKRKEDEVNTVPNQELRLDKDVTSKTGENGQINVVRKLTGDKEEKEENILKIETAIQLIQIENERLNSELIAKALADLTSVFGTLKNKYLT